MPCLPDRFAPACKLPTIHGSLPGWNFAVPYLPPAAPLLDYRCYRLLWVGLTCHTCRVRYLHLPAFYHLLPTGETYHSDGGMILFRLRLQEFTWVVLPPAWAVGISRVLIRMGGHCVFYLDADYLPAAGMPELPPPVLAGLLPPPGHLLGCLQSTLGTYTFTIPTIHLGYRSKAISAVACWDHRLEYRFFLPRVLVRLPPFAHTVTCLPVPRLPLPHLCHWVHLRSPAVTQRLPRCICQTVTVQCLYPLHLCLQVPHCLPA